MKLSKQTAKSFRVQLLCWLPFQCDYFPHEWQGRRFTTEADGARFTSDWFRKPRGVVCGELARREVDEILRKQWLRSHCFTTYSTCLYVTEDRNWCLIPFSGRSKAGEAAAIIVMRCVWSLPALVSNINGVIHYGKFFVVDRALNGVNSEEKCIQKFFSNSLRPSTVVSDALQLSNTSDTTEN